LLDYEYFTNRQGGRLVAFGHWAGVVGAYYAIKGVMKKIVNKEIPHPSTFFDANALYDYLKTFKVPPLKIVITGDGRVGQGAADVLLKNGIKKVSATNFLLKEEGEAVFCMLPFHEYVKPKAGSEMSYNDFFTYPDKFESTFKPFMQVADVYIPCHFWDPKSPVFISKDDMAKDEFNISLVADISCDVDGPVASTIRSSEHETPYYDLEKVTFNEKPAFSDNKNITVMAVDNLPTALPRNASESFAHDLLENIFPYLFGNDDDRIIKRATILHEGKLTAGYRNLDGFLNK
jgi:hypothetical protein